VDYLSLRDIIRSDPHKEVVVCMSETQDGVGALVHVINTFRAHLFACSSPPVHWDMLGVWRQSLRSKMLQQTRERVDDQEGRGVKRRAYSQDCVAVSLLNLPAWHYSDRTQRLQTAISRGTYEAADKPTLRREIARSLEVACVLVPVQAVAVGPLAVG